MGLRSQAYDRGPLLHGLRGILDLVEASLRREDNVIRVVGVAELDKSAFVNILGHATRM